jgi:hypothetical protein
MAIRLAASTAPAALATALAALAFGCGSEQKAETPAAAPAAETAAAGEAGPAAPEAAEPEVAPDEAPPAAAAATGEYPADFPSDVPRYPGSSVTSARSADDGFAMTIDTRDGVAVVSKSFGDGLTAMGWTTVVQAMPEGTMIIAEKDGNRAQALVHDGGQGALIELIVGRPQ